MSDDGQLPLTITYPPDIECFKEPNNTLWNINYQDNNCSVTENMVDFLNLTGADFKKYVSVYCLNAPSDDLCPFGFCPNPDIAGPLVRMANYVTGLCLTILIFYSTRRVKPAFWSQVLITYSLLITCSISLIRGELTRFHSIILISLVCSPVNVYFIGYSFRSFWSSHRLDAVLGKKQYGRRGLMFFALGVWTVILVYAYLPQQHTKFAQDACKGSSVAESGFLGTPIIFLVVLAESGGVGVLALFIFLMVPIVIVIAWVVAIVLRRKEIWPPGQPWRPRFGKVWRTIVTNYPFLQFLSVIVVPTAYWIGFVELGVLDTQDVNWSLTFGQVLAVFMAVPPIIEVSHSAPELWRWLINLTVVRFITRRPAPEPLAPEETGTSNAEFIDWQTSEKKGTVDSGSSFVTEQPRLGRTPDRSQGATEYGQS